MSRRALLSTFAACSLGLSSASANGRFPNAQDVLIGPGVDGDGVIAMRTTFGVLLRTRAAERFHWMCEAELFRPLAPTGNVEIPIALGASGRVFFGFPGGVHSSLDGCAVDRDPGAVDSLATDLTTSPDGTRVWALAQTPAGRWFVRAASAPDYTFAALGAGVEGVTLTNLDAAPSDPSRLYVSGVDATTRAAAIFRSDDGGATLTRTAAEGLRDTSGAVDGAYLSAVDPTDPSTLYVRAGLSTGTGLFRSTDGGRTFARLTSTRAPMQGFALSSDGQTIWVGTAEGISRSTDRGAHFEPVAPPPDGALAGMPLGGVSCLRFHAGALYACTDWVRTGYALARSTDGGAHFEPLMRFTEVDGAFTCDPSLVGPMVCGWQWPAQRAYFDRPPTDAGPTEVITGTDPPMDAAVAPVTPATPRGCGCEARKSPSPAAECATLGLLLGLSRRRARRRWRRPPPRC